MSAPETKKKKKVTGIEVTLVDTCKGTVEGQSAYTALNKSAVSFDFNSKADFNPDNDSLKLGRKFWNWLLNPLTFNQFLELAFKPEGKCLALQRGQPEAERALKAENGEDSDSSYGSEIEGGEEEEEVKE